MELLLSYDILNDLEMFFKILNVINILKNKIHSIDWPFSFCIYLFKKYIDFYKVGKIMFVFVYKTLDLLWLHVFISTFTLFFDIKSFIKLVISINILQT